MGNCSTVGQVSEATKLVSQRSLFQDIEIDLQLNNMFKKLYEDLKRLTQMSLAQQQSQQQINDLLGVLHKEVDIILQMKVIIMALQITSQCDQKKLQDFNICDQYPYLNKKIEKQIKNKQTLDLVNLYKIFTQQIEQGQALTSKILLQINEIEDFLLNKKQQYLIKNEKVQQNYAQLNKTKQKIILNQSQNINKILQDHKYIVENFKQLQSDLIQKSQFALEQQIYSIEQLCQIIRQQNTNNTLSTQ